MASLPVNDHCIGTPYFRARGGQTQSRCMRRPKSRFFRGRNSAMERRSGSTKLAPAGFVIGHAEIDTDCIFLDVHATAVSATCLCCGASSRRTQIRYLWQAADLPIAGRRVFLRVTVHRFWCGAVFCRRRIFAERFGADILAPLSRRTGRPETIVHHLGHTFGGRPAVAFADPS